MWLILAICSTILHVAVGDWYTDVPTPVQNNSWAFLVAGSKGYENYRHQSDISHAYHVMLAQGIPASQIIVMMYDDIAHNVDNPTPGAIFNSPGGPNVYDGLKIDYRRKDVNPENFLDVLTGNSEAMSGIGSGRVIQSDENTNIFVVFADHGGPGVLCFPKEVLSAARLNDVLRNMHKNKRYNKLIMYIEACYSGSMFDGILEENTNVFVMTAAARDESSFGVYCGDGTCLGDEFSVRWMQHMDSGNSGTFETFFHQYQHIRTSVRKSHVQIYGDFSVGSGVSAPEFEAVQRSMKVVDDGLSVDNKMMPVFALKLKVAKANETSARMKAQRDLQVLLEGRKTVDRLMEQLVREATAAQPQLRSTVSRTRLPLSEDIFPCYMELLDEFHTHCFGLEHDYLIHQYYKLANICVLHLDTSQLLLQLQSLCLPYKSAILSRVL